MTDFTDIFMIPDEKVFCYRSGMTVYEEVLNAGRLCSAGFNCAGFTQNVLDQMPTRLNTDLFPEPEAFYLEADGYTLNNGWEMEEFKEEEQVLENGQKVRHAALTLKNSVKPVRLIVHTVLDGTEVFTRYLTIENLSDAPMALSHVSPLSGGLETIADWRDYTGGHGSETLYDIGYMAHDTWAKEGAFRWNALPEAGYSVAGRWQRDRFRHPMFMLRNNALGTIFYAQLGWSAGYSFDFSLSAANDKANLSYKIRLDGPSPYAVLSPGESIETPKVHMLATIGDLDLAVNTMHDHMRRSVFTLPPALGIRGGLVEAGMGPERIMDVTATKHFADTAAAVGAEALVIDAGWYCPLGTERREWWARVGDWVPDAGHYPNGIDEIRNYIHAKGLLFGLWLDIERIGHMSRLFATHPDWAIRDMKGEYTTLLDFSNPEVAEWAENELARVLTEYKVDLFRLDYNIDGKVTMFYVNHREDGCSPRESGAARYHKAVYAMYERLRRRFPNIIFENCAGGGGRTDLGMLANFTHTWVSDWQVAPRSVAITNGMTMALPPEYVDRLCSGMNSHTRASLDLIVRNTLFGRPTTNDYNAVGTTFNPQQIEFVRHSFDIYKNFIRPFAPTGRIYHHTHEKYGNQPDGDVILERSAADKTRSVIGVFRLSGKVEKEELVVYPRGIDIGKRYRVFYDNSRGSALSDGFTLVNEGIRVRLPGTLTSELILLEEVQ